MTFERICAEHETPLLEQTCAYQHGGGYECDQWYLVRDGVVVAECTEARVRWLRGACDGGTRKIEGRDEEGRIGLRAGRRAGPTFDLARVQASRRKRERERAEKEGREPAEWAKLQASTRRKRSPETIRSTKQAQQRRQRERDAAIREGREPAAWAAMRRPAMTPRKVA